MLAAIATVLVACGKKDKSDVEENFVATFEEAEISPAELDSELLLDSTGTFQSGNFIFKQVVKSRKITGNIVSNHTDTTYASTDDAWKSVAGGAFEGNNYVVYHWDSIAQDTIKLVKATTVPGFYVTNGICTYKSMKDGDPKAGVPFETGDVLQLIITGIRDTTVTGTVEFYLGKATSLVDEWTYVHLSTLKEVDGLIFSLRGTRNNASGLLTPAYFAIDNLGAKE